MVCIESLSGLAERILNCQKPFIKNNISNNLIAGNWEIKICILLGSHFHFNYQPGALHLKYILKRIFYYNID